MKNLYRLLIAICLVYVPFAMAAPLPTAAPEDVGISSERLARLTSMLTSAIDAGELPGAVIMVARDGKLVYSRALGSQNKAAGTAMREDSIFRIYSMTKPIVSVAAMMLIEQGKLWLADPVSKFIPAFAGTKVGVESQDGSGAPILELVDPDRPMTVQDLLRHTSGLAYGGVGPRTAVKKLYGEAKIRSQKWHLPEFAEALNFYVDLLNDAGEDDAANSSFNECKTLYEEGKVAMWYDATVAASLFPEDVVANTAFALAPVKETANSGWLWAWTLAIPASTTDQDAAWQFIDWATNADYHELVAAEDGWAAVPPGTRQSLYERPEYQEAAEAFAQRTLDAMLAAPIDNPGTTPRPGLPGVQYVGVPEFQDVGTRCTELFSAAIAGSMSVDAALSDCQIIASEVST